jgi:hypothetical protein
MHKTMSSHTSTLPKPGRSRRAGASVEFWEGVEVKVLNADQNPPHRISAASR